MKHWIHHDENTTFFTMSSPSTRHGKNEACNFACGAFLKRCNGQAGSQLETNWLFSLKQYDQHGILEVRGYHDI